MKYAVVFQHDKTRFEVWLSGRNRAVMSEYHEKINALPLKDYFLSADEKGMSSIIEKTMVDKPDFDNPTELTAQLDNGVRQFIRDIEKTFLKNP